MPVNTYYLFEWHPWQSDSLSILFGYLKGVENRKAWAFYAREFWRGICKKEAFEKFQNAVLIPCPSADPKKEDHALTFCKELSNVSGIPFVKPLKRTANRQQKRSNKMERRKLTFEVNENFSPSMLSGKYLIFVDDVVTTGATAIAAQKALKAGKNYEVWSLAIRSQKVH